MLLAYMVKETALETKLWPLRGPTTETGSPEISFPRFPRHPFTVGFSQLGDYHFWVHIKKDLGSLDTGLYFI